MLADRDLTPVVLTDAPAGLRAEILPGAGMLVTSLTHHGDELLGQRRGLGAYLRDGKTMGIPLLAPWANRVGADRFSVAGMNVELAQTAPGLRRDPNGLAIHGVLAADRGWVIDEVTPGALHARLDFGARPELLASFPFPHELSYAASLSEGALTLELVVRATGDVGVPVAHGLHPYLALPGAERADWQVELPSRDHLALDAQGLPTGDRSREPAWEGVLGARVFDDAYDGLAPGARFVVSGGGRTIVTTFEAGYPAAQVFAPSEDAVICFEPMAAPTNALVSGHGLRVVLPGSEDVSRVRIEVR